MRTPVKLYLVLLLSVAMPANGAGQLSGADFTGELSIKLSNSEIKKFDNASKLILEADNILKTAVDSFTTLSEADVSLRSSPEYRDIIDIMYKASDLYREGFELAFSIFISKREAFWKSMSRSNHRAAGMDKALYYENSSDAQMKRSLIRFDQVMENDRFNYAHNILNDAVKLGRLALRDAGRSVQILEDYPVEYNYGWDDDPTLEEIIRLLKDPNVNEPPDDIFATVDAGKTVDSTLFKEIIFKVQIAAHTEPLTEEYLSSVYNGTIKIDLIFEEAWYKYSIGRYLTYDEAEATRRECNISKAFVVAYQDGRKIGTQEALDIAERMKEDLR